MNSKVGHNCVFAYPKISKLRQLPHKNLVIKQICGNKNVWSRTSRFFYSCFCTFTEGREPLLSFLLVGSQCLKFLFQMGCRYSFPMKPIKVPEVAVSTKEISRDLQMTCRVCRRRPHL